MFRWMRQAGTLTGVAVLLWLAGCGGGGNGGDDSEPPVMLEGNEAVQATTAVVRSTVAILVGLRTENVLPSSPTSTCSAGSVDASCKVENGQSIVRASFDQCRVPLGGGQVETADGDLRLEINDLGACSPFILETTSFEIELSDFLEILTDASGNELSRSRTDGTDRIVPSGPGCAGRNVIEEIDATIDAVTHTRVPGRLVVDGADVEVRALALQTNQTSAGSPCVRTMVVDGQMDIDDRANGVRFSQTLSGLIVSYIEVDDDALVEIDGAISNGCIGDVTLATVEPIRLHNATDCPTGGLLRVTAGGRTSEMRFGPSGVFAIDYDGDGQYELIASTCRDALIAECTR